MRCSFCNHDDFGPTGSGPRHHPDCPYIGTDEERRLKLASFYLGYRHGRSGKAYSTKWYNPESARLFLFEIAHPGAWAMGVGNGIVALEEFENSEPPDYG